MMNRFDYLPNYRYYNDSTGVIETQHEKPLRDYTIEGNIASVGEVSEATPYGYIIPVTVEGKNLIKPQDIYSVNPGNLCTEVVEDGRRCIRFIDTIKGEFTGYNFKPETQYTISFDCKSEIRSSANETGSMLIKLWYSDGTNSLLTINRNSDWGHRSLTSTFGKTIIAVGLDVFNYVNWVYIDVDTFQFEEGSAETPYEPYIPPKTYNIYLDEPLRKVGDYADLISYKSNKLIRKTAVSDNSLYVLDKAVETDIELPEIKTHKGTNVITVGTNVQPSAVNWQYYK